MHRHFGMSGIIRVGGEPPDVAVSEAPAARDTNASAISGASPPLERYEDLPQRLQQ